MTPRSQYSTPRTVERGRSKKYERATTQRIASTPIVAPTPISVDDLWNSEARFVAIKWHGQHILCDFYRTLSGKGSNVRPVLSLRSRDTAHLFNRIDAEELFRNVSPTNKVRVELYRPEDVFDSLSECARGLLVGASRCRVAASDVS